nr:type II toxin-antitoxin system HicA family toxin [Methanofollis tationis]
MRAADGRTIVLALQHMGFEPIRQRGSHVILKHPDGSMTVVPVHEGEEIGRGLLRTIIRETGLTKDQFLQILDEIA